LIVILRQSERPDLPGIADFQCSFVEGRAPRAQMAHYERKKGWGECVLFSNTPTTMNTLCAPLVEDRLDENAYIMRTKCAQKCECEFFISSASTTYRFQHRKCTHFLEGRGEPVSFGVFAVYAGDNRSFPARPLLQRSPATPSRAGKCCNKSRPGGSYLQGLTGVGCQPAGKAY